MICNLLLISACLHEGQSLHVANLLAFRVRIRIPPSFEPSNSNPLERRPPTRWALCERILKDLVTPQCTCIAVLGESFKVSCATLRTITTPTLYLKEGSHKVPPLASFCAISPRGLQKAFAFWMLWFITTRLLRTRTGCTNCSPYFLGHFSLNP